MEYLSGYIGGVSTIFRNIHVHITLRLKGKYCNPSKCLTWEEKTIK